MIHERNSERLYIYAEAYLWIVDKKRNDAKLWKNEDTMTRRPEGPNCFPYKDD